MRWTVRVIASLFITLGLVGVLYGGLAGGWREASERREAERLAWLRPPPPDGQIDFSLTTATDRGSVDLPIPSTPLGCLVSMLAGGALAAATFVSRRDDVEV